jgi:FkbM family methyltransferase
MRGKARLARHILGGGIEAQDAVINGRGGLLYATPSLREPIAFSLLINGVYEFRALEFVIERLRTGSIFVDVGANIGSFTIPAAQKVGINGCVIAVEPSPRIFPYLQRNVALNKVPNVRLVRRAASDRDGECASFYEAPVEKFGMGSLAPRFQVNPVPILCQTLDTILEEQRVKQVTVIKIDVEGFEAAVLQGAEKVLTSDSTPVVVFEFCDWAESSVPGGHTGDAQRVLKSLGYDIWRLRDIISGKPPLTAVVTTGFDMLVAMRL